jgi:hypothetical protein
MMKKTVILTSINPPTPAVARFAALPDWDVLVVGDVKTPPAWHCPAVSYVSVEMQKALPFKTVQHLPWNHYARKMIGYLLAAREGAVLLVAMTTFRKVATSSTFTASLPASRSGPGAFR